MIDRLVFLLVSHPFFYRIYIDLFVTRKILFSYRPIIATVNIRHTVYDKKREITQSQ
jgi:hypothetical protein